MIEFNLEDGLICYNWTPLVSDYVIDYPQEFYDEWGVKRLHDKENMKISDIDEMKENDVIFVKTDFVINGQFQNEIMSKIKTPFNLITAASSYLVERDMETSQSYKDILNNEYLKNWFCTNPPKEENDKLHGLPVGFAEPNRPIHNQKVLRKLQKSRKSFEEKENMFFLPYHSPDTNKEREKILTNLKKHEFVHTMPERMSIEPYIKSMGDYRFILCVQGSGDDTHRLYESLLVGSIPITIDCSIKKIFDEYNLPGYFVNSWDEVDMDFYKEVSEKEYDFSNVNSFLQVNTHANKIRNCKNVGIANAE